MSAALHHGRCRCQYCRTATQTPTHKAAFSVTESMRCAADPPGVCAAVDAPAPPAVVAPGRRGEQTAQANEEGTRRHTETAAEREYFLRLVFGGGLPSLPIAPRPPPPPVAARAPGGSRRAPAGARASVCARSSCRRRLFPLFPWDMSWPRARVGGGRCQTAAPRFGAGSHCASRAPSLPSLSLSLSADSGGPWRAGCGAACCPRGARELAWPPRPLAMCKRTRTTSD